MSLARRTASSSDVKRLDRRDRAENLLAQHGGVVGHAGRAPSRDRSSPCPDGALPPMSTFAPLAVASSTSSSTLSRGVGIDQRAERDAILEPVPHAQRAHARGELLGKGVVHLFVHVEAVGGGAGLADVAHLGDHRALDRGVDVGVVEHDERRVAAELHRRLEHVVGRLVQQLAPDLGRAGEGHDPHPRVVQHRARPPGRSGATE